MDDPLARTLDEVAMELRRRRVCGDWVDAFHEHDAIGTDEAAAIGNCVPNTIRRWAREAAASGRPIGIWFAQSVWLISKAKLLDNIEERDGLHERVAATARAAKYAQMRVPQQTSHSDDLAATG